MNDKTDARSSERDFEIMLSRIVWVAERSTNIGQLDRLISQARGLLNRKGSADILRTAENDSPPSK